MSSLNVEKCNVNEGLSPFKVLKTGEEEKYEYVVNGFGRDGGNVGDECEEGGELG